MKTEDEQPNAILKYGHLITHTHIAEKEGRTSPGVHGEDFRPYFEALKKIRYKGMISIECQWKNIDSQALIGLNTIKNQV
jgi:sugar phosphate isomerase/epimerase